MDAPNAPNPANPNAQEPADQNQDQVPVGPAPAQGPVQHFEFWLWSKFQI